MDARDLMMHEGDVITSDHRTRVAAAKRERMRARLMEAALLIFGQADASLAVVDEVIRRADVSRGTFYNYFQNPDELLKAVAFETGAELMQAVAPIVESHDDPAERVAAGVKSWMSLVSQYPHLAGFFRRAGLYILESDRVRADLPRDLVLGMKSGQFSIKELELGFVLVAGTVLAAINTLAVGPPPADFGSKLAERILMSLGVDAGDARRISRLKLGRPELQPGSLIARSSGAIPG